MNTFSYEECARLAHGLNIIWSRRTDTINSPTTNWNGLSAPARKEKTKRMELIAKENPPCPAALHERWLKTAPTTHPRAIPYDELPEGQKIKDDIFYHCLQLARIFNQ